MNGIIEPGMKVKSESYLGSITALLVIDDLLLVGTGGYVEVYDVHDRTLVQKCRIFDDTTNIINGFCQTSEKKNSFLAFGGKTIKSVLINSQTNAIESIQVFHAKDWLMSVHWSQDFIWAVSAHNELLRFDGEKSSEIRCQDEQCILYSACIVDDTNEIIVIGGTTFKQIIIWGSSNGKLYHRLCGHQGVIFSVNFNEELNILCSTSDDRSARLWTIHKGATGWSDSEILPSHILSGVHQSRIFRSLFLNDKVIVTGGEDSTVAFWSTETGESLGKYKANNGQIWSLAKSPKNVVISGSGNGTVKFSQCPEKESIQNVRFGALITKEDCPRIVTFWKEIILVLTVNGNLISVNPMMEPTLILQDNDLANYALMSLRDDSLYFATIDGQLKWVQLPSSNLQSEKICDGKIFALTVSSNSKRVFTCLKDGKIVIYEHLLPDKLQKVKELVLPYTKDQRWFSCVDELSNCILVGDRCGFLHIFNDTADDLPVTTIKAHGKHGIGFVKATDDSTIFTAGRDGLLKSYNLIDGHRINLVATQHLKLPWIERWLDQDTICGFHSSSFIVYSVYSGTPLAEIECGGGHRSWDYNGRNFAFIKDKEVLLAKRIIKENVVKCGGHLKEINCVEQLRFGEESFIVTGGEDTTMKLWRTSLNPIATLRRHISSIKCLAVEDYSMDERLLATAGGRSELRLWVVTQDKATGKIGCNELACHFLKGNDKQRQRNWREHDLIDDNEPFYSSIVILKSKIIIACSDGALRLWSFSSSQLKLEKQSDPLPNALLKLQKTADGQLLTGDTIGRLMLWNEDLQLVKSIENVHQNGINAMLSLNGSVISGGDDGKIAITRLDTKSVTKSIPSHSAAHITALLEVNDGLCCVSVDQRISFFTRELEWCNQAFSHCPDIASSVFIPQENLLIVIGSNGLERFLIG